jgi:hypothetical protein
MFSQYDIRPGVKSVRRKWEAISLATALCGKIRLQAHDYENEQKSIVSWFTGTYLVTLSELDTKSQIKGSL